MKKVLVAALALLSTSTLMLHAGDITGTITLKGTPPKEADIPAAKDDPNCGKLQGGAMPTTHHYVVGKNGELANCVIALKGASGGSKGDSAAPLVLDQRKCAYTPQIMACQTGQKITIKNSDPLMHNVRTTSMQGNKDINNAQGPGAPDIVYTPSKAENFLKFQCDVHNWMFAWVSVFDHPYFAVSDENGKYTIKNVPDGKYTIEVFHRKAAPASHPATAEVEVKGGNVTKDFTLEVPAK